jgi:two-component system, cell cycle sensor histidine kinase and response regulator CckA
VKRLDVRLRLGATFCLLAAVLFVVGWQGVSYLRQLDREMQEVIYDRLSEEQQVREAFHLSDLNSRIMLSIFLIDDQVEIKRLLAQRAANSKRITELFDAIASRLNTEEEKRLLAAVEAARKSYIESYKLALAKLLDEHHAGEAKKMMVEVSLPSIAVYHTAWGVFTQHQIDKIEKAIKQSKADFALAQRRLEFMVFLASLITVATALYVTSRVTREVADRQRAQKDLKESNDLLEQRIQQRTAELAQTNHTLQMEVVEHTRVEEELRLKSAFLEAQVNSSLDGILVVDQNRKTSLQNQRFVDLFKLPRHIADEEADENRFRWVTEKIKNPEPFIQKVLHLYAHPNEISHDEIGLKDGTTLDRHSFPAIGKDGKYYGRVWTFRDITARKRAEEALRASDEKFRQLAGNISDVFWMTSPDMQQVHYVSPAYERIWGRSAASLDEHPQEWAEAILPEERDHVFATFGRLAKGEPSVDVEFRITRPDGEVRWIHSRGFQVRDAAGRVIRLTGIASDITERKRIESQMIQSQRLETVGKLAGGVAHEFNSILTAIIGQSEIILSDLPPESRLCKNAAEIRQAADRAAVLTRQLLAYGRKQILQPETLDLNRVLAGMESTLHHLVGRGVNVRIVAGPGLKAVKTDPGQIEQVIVNITMNAAEVMPNGGKLTLETANVTLDDEYVSHFSDLKAGEYVMLAISDTGTGISQETKKHLFEPFFSTKGVGQGAGLGLATCYGIIKQSGGHINVYSELSRGATFKIYLPQVEARTEIPAPRHDAAHLPRGTETILLVEDDPALREMASTLLTRLGYTVLAAADGVEALSLKHRRGAEHIDLVFTDVVMPHMSGKELSDRFRVLYPQTRVLFTSAYTENAIVHQGVLNPGVTLLQKPFTPSALAVKVREVLDRDDLAPASHAHKE